MPPPLFYSHSNGCLPASLQHLMNEKQENRDKKGMDHSQIRLFSIFSKKTQFSAWETISLLKHILLQSRNPCNSNSKLCATNKITFEILIWLRMQSAFLKALSFIGAEYHQLELMVLRAWPKILIGKNLKTWKLYTVYLNSWL